MLFGEKDSYEIMLETYIGRTENLRKAELELQKIITRINNWYVTMNTQQPIRFTQEGAALEKYFYKEFGTPIYVNFAPIELAANHLAYTWITSFPLNFYKVDENFKKTGRIVSHERLLPITITIGYALIHDYKLTSEELMGLLLHEIGHNIQRYFILESLFIPIILYNRLNSILGTSLDQTFSLLQSLPVLNQVIRGIIWVDWGLTELLGSRHLYIISLLNLMMAGPEALLRAVDPVSHINGYAIERYCDSMATAYGYGPGLASGLTKITTTSTPTAINKAIHSNPVTSMLDEIIVTTYEICFMITLLGVHPQTVHRIENQIRKCERDLANGDFPPNQRKSLEQDLKYLKRVLNSYLNADDANNDAFVKFFRGCAIRYGLNPLRNIALRDYYENLEV